MEAISELTGTSFIACATHDGQPIPRRLAPASARGKLEAAKARPNLSIKHSFLPEKQRT
jgi:hypothetical protein